MSGRRRFRQRCSGSGAKHTMIVNRRTFVPRRGRETEAIAYLEADIKRLDRSHSVRVTRCDIGVGGLSVEWDFENLKEYEEFWAAYFSSPEGAAFVKEWRELTETTRTNEIWTLME